MLLGGMQSLVIEGYASLFGVGDLAGDVVPAGALTRTLGRGAGVGMLLSHVGGRTAGRWTKMREDGHGLFVHGMVSAETIAGATKLSIIGSGRPDWLSFGFVARDWSPRVIRGRELKEIELQEISLVSALMLSGARFAPVGDIIKIPVMKAS